MFCITPVVGVHICLGYYFTRAFMPFGEKMAVTIPSEAVVVIFNSKCGASVRCAKVVAHSGCVQLGDRAII